MIFVVVPALFATLAQVHISIHAKKRLIFVHFTKANCKMEKTVAFGAKHKRRMPNDLQTNPVQRRYGTSHSGGPENADTAGDKAAAHKTKMEQHRLARLE